ncbi:hypothetical protein pb186bvf_005659 [Paramecium bursaria]
MARQSPLNSSFRQTPPIFQEPTLQSNIFMFLSIIHSNQQLKYLFVQKCNNKDRFLYQFDMQKYDQILNQVLQIFNSYFNGDIYIQPQPEPISSIIKKMVINDIEPLKDQLLKSPESYQRLTNLKASYQTQSATYLLSKKLQKSNTKPNVEDLKKKIHNLALQHDIQVKSKDLQYIFDPNKPNRISFGNALQTNASEQKILNSQSSIYNLGSSASPTFSKVEMDEQRKEKKRPKIFIEEKKYQHPAQRRKKSSSVQPSSQTTPKGSRERFDNQSLFIEQIPIRKKSTNSPRQFNILTNQDK